MILGIEREAAIFADAVLAGFFVWGVYAALRIFRRIIHHGPGWIAAEDMCYWLLTAVFLFREMYITCDGSIRWYFVLGTVLGAFTGAGIFGLIRRGCHILRTDFRGKKGKSIDKSEKRR